MSMHVVFVYWQKYCCFQTEVYVNLFSYCKLNKDLFGQTSIMLFLHKYQPSTYATGICSPASASFLASPSPLLRHFVYYTAQNVMKIHIYFLSQTSLVNPNVVIPLLSTAYLYFWCVFLFVTSLCVTEHPFLVVSWGCESNVFSFKPCPNILLILKLLGFHGSQFCALFFSRNYSYIYLSER